MDTYVQQLWRRRFTRADRRRLARTLARTPLARVYRRVEAVLLVAEGHGVAESARRVRADRKTVERWVRRYLATHDPSALADRPRVGRPRVARQLTDRQVLAALQRDPRGLGYQATTWTVALLAHYCAKRHACRISPRTLRRRLHALGYRWKRPRYVYRHRAKDLGAKRGLSAAA